MHPIEKWHKLVKSNDPNKFDELLDENCTFYSPVVFQCSPHLLKDYL